jgi:hypothetical protein
LFLSLLSELIWCCTSLPMVFFPRRRFSLCLFQLSSRSALTCLCYSWAAAASNMVESGRPVLCSGHHGRCLRPVLFSATGQASVVPLLLSAFYKLTVAAESDRAVVAEPTLVGSTALTEQAAVAEFCQTRRQNLRLICSRLWIGSISTGSTQSDFLAPA